MPALAGKTAIVTGASRGLGRAIAQLFAAEGANVAVVDLKEHWAQATVDAIVADGGRAMAIGADGTATLLLDAGTRRLTVRVDARGDRGPAWPIRVEVVRARESPAEFSVVGGR